MSRKVNSKLITRLIEGDLQKLLEFLKGETDKLRLEVRTKGKCIIYYKKCKILELGLNSYHIDKQYFTNNNEPSNIKDEIINNPNKYFEKTTKIIDNWLIEHPKNEFDSQQNIAKYNQDVNDKYLIIDMEYAFEQHEILEKEREKKASIDLLGIERATGKIILFEVKTGLGAITGSSGIDEHINDFEKYLNGKHKDLFRKNLRQDVENIIGDKIQLGLIEDDNILNKISQEVPELIFVFHPKSNDDIASFKTELNNRKELIIVSDKDYKLK